MAAPPEPSVPKRKFFVTRRCACEGDPVGGMFFSPSASKACLMFAGVSPFGIVKAMSRGGIDTPEDYAAFVKRLRERATP